MRTIFSIVACLLALTASPGQGRSHPTHPATPPVLGAWRFVGTAPPGFVRQGTDVAQLTLSLQRGRLYALVTTGKHRYASDGRYVAAQRQLLLTVRTSGGVVRLQATLGAGSAGAARMLGIWSDTHGDDGGFVLLHVPGTSRRGTAGRR